MIAVDTNLIVYAHRAATAEHIAAKRAIERASNDRRGWGIPMPCVAEFWSIVTHPSASGRPSTGEETQAFLFSLSLDGGARIWLPGPGFAERLTQSARDLEVHGVRIFDLQIALIAFESGAHELWTHDSNFRTVPGLRLMDPI